MRFSVAAVLAFAASAFAQTPDFDPVYTPKKDETVTAGSSFTLTWDAPPKYADGTISIELIGGATQNTQQPIAKIACESSTTCETVCKEAQSLKYALTSRIINSWCQEQRPDLHLER